jgi:hypothetical protein
MPTAAGAGDNGDGCAHGTTGPVTALNVIFSKIDPTDPPVRIRGSGWVTQTDDWVTVQATDEDRPTLISATGLEISFRKVSMS